MTLTKSYFYFFIALITNQINIINSQSISYGVVCVPVADLMGEKLTNSNEYSQLPLSGQGEPWRICPRVHQLLFNEVVIIEKKENKQYCIRTPQLFFVTPSNKHPMNLYWIRQDHLMPLDTLLSHKISLTTIPQPFGSSLNIGLTHKALEIITLIKPFYDTVTKQTFSAGTRFVLAPDTKDNSDNHRVWVLDAHNKTAKQTNIPHAIAKTFNEKETPKEKIKTFVRTLKQWAHLENGFIPYVWGGCSFQKVHTIDEIEIIKNNRKDQPAVEVVVYKNKLHNKKPKDGCDCAGLVVRAAQNAGIPYFFKNTYTLAHYLKPVTKYIAEGDLIWIRGHVLIVADIEKNTVIEARDFSDGYGKVHEIALNKVFSGMNTFDDLMNAFKENKPLIRLNHPLGKTKEYDTFKILSMESVWEVAK